ncbi:hypothetical protein EX30DRAFT_376570 [Ascodesmis nigricans]|uniref:DUF3835 domain-containing protein n=1 Tax=Ascodesmis nigricans TaxID=341454 RepID=A0A4S2N727_9PEZI|nr:hypothetical protein EX30DRAFT_376570 [Ascodesmis nigricans]
MPPKQVNIESALDQQRLRLEESISKLRKALTTWQNWSAEYEAFREELQALPEYVSRDDMLAAGLSIEGSLLDEREIKDLLGDKSGTWRSRGQVIKVVSDRIEYVEKNVNTIGKSLGSDETKLEKLLIISNPGDQTEEGLPFMEITEFLDDEDNIINATVNGKDPQALNRSIDTDTLGQFEKFIDNEAKSTAIANPSPSMKSISEPTAASTADSLSTPPESTTPVNHTDFKDDKPVANEPETPVPGKSPQESSITTPIQDSNVQSATTGPDPTTDGDTEEIESFMEHESGGFVKVLPDPEIPELSWVQTVPGESEEEAELRREMLEYSMSEVGDVVAELNLEESGDFYGYEGYSDEDFSDAEYDSEATSEEDEYGRTINKRVMNASYRREMEELQQMIKDREAKLGGKKAAPLPPPPAHSSMASSTGESSKPKKGVRFNEELDISPAPVVPVKSAPQSPPSPPPAVPFAIANLHDIAPEDEDAIPYLTELMARTGMYNAGPIEPVFETPPPVEKPKEKGPSLFKKEKQTSTAATTEAPVTPQQVPDTILSTSVLERPPTISSSTLSDNVLERASTAPAIPPSAPAPRKKLPRFKEAQLAAAARDSSPPPVPQPQPLLSSSVIERGPSTVARPPDDMDPDFHRKEVAESFHKLRNKMIQQQGGFSRTEDREEDSIIELEEDGEVKKVSRFKAARLRGLGPK